MNINEEYDNKLNFGKEQSNGNNQPELGMKWFKFLVYFLLFFGAAEDLIHAVAMIFNIKNEFLDFDYYFIGNLRWLGILFAVAFVVSAAAGIYFRFELAKFKKGAPKKYIIFEIATQLLFLVYNLAGIFSDSSLETYKLVGSFAGAVIGCVVGGAIFIYPSIIYFKKRNHLFVN